MERAEQFMSQGSNVVARSRVRETFNLPCQVPSCLGTISKANQWEILAMLPRSID